MASEVQPLSIVREAGFVNGRAEFYTIYSKATGPVGEGLISAFRYLRFWRHPHRAPAMTTHLTPHFGLLPMEVGFQRDTSFEI